MRCPECKGEKIIRWRDREVIKGKPCPTCSGTGVIKLAEKEVRKETK
jgi:DnaJ-class molecular chaperone